MNIDEIIASARTVGFENLEAIRQLARPAVELIPGGPLGEAAAGSRFGGLPALPPSVPWPRRDGSSLAFIAQIDLAAQPALAVAQGFPGDGLLLFFYDAEQGTWGFDPKDAGSFAVFHVPVPTTAAIHPWPGDLPEHARYKAVKLVQQPTVSLPPWESVLVDGLDLDEEQQDAYQNLMETACHGNRWAMRGFLGGYPDQVQSDMSLECAIVAAGLSCGDGKAYKDPRLPEFKKQARDWRLLLQVPSVDSADMSWGDAGCLYYWIREEDLRARRFDASWMILQCY